MVLVLREVRSEGRAALRREGSSEWVSGGDIGSSVSGNM